MTDENDTSDDGDMLIAEVVRATIPSEKVAAVISAASLDLSFAAMLHRGGAQREGMMWALTALMECFERLGIPSSELEPVRHLFHSLMDLERGVADAPLTPNPVHNRKGEPISEWCARACLSAALEARDRLGENPKRAAKDIATHFDVLGDGTSQEPANRATAANRLIGWRDNFNRQRSSFNGIHLTVYATSTALMDRADEVGGEKRAEYLGQLWKRALSHAADYRRRVVRSGNNPPP